MADFDDLRVDHVRFAVADPAAAAADWERLYGLTAYARAAGSVAVGAGDIRLVLAADESYVELHGDGVADIALRTADAAAAFHAAVRRGARPVAAPHERDGVVRASIAGFGDVVHTFVERADGGEPRVPASGGLLAVDHFAVCVEPGRLGPTVDFYARTLGFREVFTERIVVGDQAMDSIAVQSRSGGVTFTVIEPDVTRKPGQIDAFIADHGGAGVQHIAFTTSDIVADVGRLRAAGIAFLPTPGTYYDMLDDRLSLTRHTPGELRALDILADQDPDGQLLQIFTRSTHPRNTLFFELIERLGARTFGSGNVKALYSAVERQRVADDERR